MPSDAVKVAVRVRPQNDQEKRTGKKVCTVVEGDAQIVVNKDRRFVYDYAFHPNTTQAEVYNSCVKNLVADIFNGFNATILAYGQTGSGKTYTMGTSFVDATSLESTGIIPRAVQQIFNTIDELKRKAKESHGIEPTFTVEAQFIELYNEELVDLLAGDRNSNVKISEDANTKEIVIKNARKMQTNVPEEVMNILKIGSDNRSTAETKMNQQSSRSHAIFSLYFQQSTLETVSENEQVVAVLTAKLHFVDLAGSERLKRTGATGERAKEGISINSGLLALGNVICALTDSTRNHVPYRDSKLTRLLQDSLGGNSRTLMMACVSPTEIDSSETLSTVEYAARAKKIQNHVIVNKDYETTQILQLKARIVNLETELKLARETQQDFRVSVKNDEPVDLVDAFKTSIENMQLEFKSKVEKALGNKPLIDSLVSTREGLIDLTEQFRENLENFLHVLVVPSRSTTKRSRRCTIFDGAPREKNSRKRITTLMAFPNNLENNDHEFMKFEENADPNDQVADLKNKLNAAQQHNLELQLKLESIVEEWESKYKALEQSSLNMKKESEDMREKSESTIAYLTTAMSSLKQELASKLENKK